ncbi:hypothetical protein N9L53_02695, partial [Schleiferiaceae bacterium]|nr:hypothetical protein [Schleiferiaceae bacterium]
AYIDGYVRQHLDTTISQQQIQDYYDQNLSNFELKESIVQAYYAAAPLNAGSETLVPFGQIPGKIFGLGRSICHETK